MISENMKPRELARLMIEDFVSGGQVQIDPKAYPKAIQGTAIAHARNTAALIVHHARRARTDRPYRRALQQFAGAKKNGSMKGLATLVLRYEQSREKPETPRSAP